MPHIPAPAAAPTGQQLPAHPASLEVWSCNPADIPPWTPQAKARLDQALAQVFGWAPDVAGAASPADKA